MIERLAHVHERHWGDDWEHPMFSDLHYCHSDRLLKRHTGCSLVIGRVCNIEQPRRIDMLLCADLGNASF